MPDVSVSFAEPDHDLARQLCDHLEARGWATSRNLGLEIPRDNFDKVIVLWSRNSVGSPFFLHHAIIARDAGKLVQVKTADVQLADIPSGLRFLPILDVSDLEAVARAVADEDPEPIELSVSELLDKRRKLARLEGTEAALVTSPITGAVFRAPALKAEIGATPSSIQPRRATPFSKEEVVGFEEPPQRREPFGAAQQPQQSPISVPRPSIRTPSIGTELVKPPRRQSSPEPMEPASASRKAGGIALVIASGVAAFGATVIAVRTGVVDNLLTKLLALLNLNVFPPVGAPKQPQENAEIVDFSAFAPPSAPGGKSVFVQVFLHAPSDLERAETIANKIDEIAQLRSSGTLQTELVRGQRLTVRFDCAELKCDEPIREVVWRGHPQAVSFRVTIPTDTADRHDFFPKVRVSIEGVPVGFLEFMIICRNEKISEADGAGKAARRYKYAFLSYAVQDRNEVTKFARALNAARIDFFQDILSLDPGDQWEQRLFEEIDRCDVFYLFWSHHAAASAMVRKEAEHAYRRASLTISKLPDITPIRLDDALPTNPPHASWMTKIHFDDRFRQLIRD